MDWIKNAPNFFLFSGVFRCPRQYFLFKVFQMFSRPWIFWSSCSTYLQTIFPTDPPTWFSLHHTFVTNETVLFDIIFNLKDNLIFLELKTCNVEFTSTMWKYNKLFYKAFDNFSFDSENLISTIISFCSSNSCSGIITSSLVIFIFSVIFLIKFLGRLPDQTFLVRHFNL